jgi:hypothetical protein
MYFTTALAALEENGNLSSAFEKADSQWVGANIQNPLEIISPIYFHRDRVEERN